MLDHSFVRGGKNAGNHLTIRRLEDEGKIPALPVHIDSPMAINATDIIAPIPKSMTLI